MYFRQDVSIERLRDLLEYNPETGALTWRERTIIKRTDKQINGRHAGKPAGYIARNGYHSVGVDGRDMAAHRIIHAIVTGSYPDGEIDHRNGIKSDNRWCNLRIATHAQNSTHRGPAANNTSGARGVSWRRDIQKWRVYLRTDGRWISGGFFDDFEQAKARYWEMAYEMRGEFAGF